MSTVVVATTREDAAAAEAVENHHAALSGELSALVARLARAVESGSLGVASDRDRLVAFAREQLLPHAAAEEATLYPAAHDDATARLLVDAMLVEHVVLRGLVEQLEGAGSGVAAVGYARALQVLFDSHLSKENDQVLPLLAGSASVSLAGLLGGMHELLGGHDHAGHDHAGHDDAGHDHAAAAPAAHTCNCGHDHDDTVPELDARFVPHDIRHATIFGALSAVPPGGAMVLVAPHDPLPLLAQIEAREPGAFAVQYLQRGPDAWRLAFTRAGG